MVYFIVRTVFLKPFKEGYKQSAGEGGHQGRGGASSREGEVSVSYKPEQKTPQKGKTGEYVDYEEVKE